ncbi:MAG TPA: hypothetical protein VGC42_30165 [Kofleriaceae bacterium]
MGRDRARVLICAIAAIALILTGALAMDWAPVMLIAGVTTGVAAMYLALPPAPAPVARPRAPGRPRSQSLPMPIPLRGRLAYLAVTVELTAGGIDARREDGSARLILWRDIVGVACRRLPPAYGGTTFVDIVSTAGSTLRVVRWTRVSGEPLVGGDDDRPRGIIERVAARCPGARIDPATRLFLETGEAAQLPDLATLDDHDQRLA